MNTNEHTEYVNQPVEFDEKKLTKTIVVWTLWEYRDEKT